jgi:hypothetical protein
MKPAGERKDVTNVAIINAEGEIEKHRIISDRIDLAQAPEHFQADARKFCELCAGRRCNVTSGEKPSGCPEAE